MSKGPTQPLTFQSKTITANDDQEKDSISLITYHARLLVLHKERLNFILIPVLPNE